MARVLVDDHHRPAWRLAHEVRARVLPDVPKSAEIAVRLRLRSRPGEKANAGGVAGSARRAPLSWGACPSRAQTSTSAARVASHVPSWPTDTAAGPGSAPGAPAQPGSEAERACDRVEDRVVHLARRPRSAPPASAGGRSRRPEGAASRRTGRRPGAGPAASVPAKARSTAWAAPRSRTYLPLTSRYSARPVGSEWSGEQTTPWTRTSPRRASTATRWRCGLAPERVRCALGQGLARAGGERPNAHRPLSVNPTSGRPSATRITASARCPDSVEAARMNLRLAGVLKKRSRTSTVVPRVRRCRARPRGWCHPRPRPGCRPRRRPTRCRAGSGRRRRWPGRASPRKPMVAMAASPSASCELGGGVALQGQPGVLRHPCRPRRRPRGPARARRPRPRPRWPGRRRRGRSRAAPSPPTRAAPPPRPPRFGSPALGGAPECEAWPCR